jgi:hypothetical protein
MIYGSMRSGERDGTGHAGAKFFGKLDLRASKAGEGVRESGGAEADPEDLRMVEDAWK